MYPFVLYSGGICLCLCLLHSNVKNNIFKKIPSPSPESTDLISSHPILDSSKSLSRRSSLQDALDNLIRRPQRIQHPPQLIIPTLQATDLTHHLLQLPHLAELASGL